ncbi:MAG TPA: phosphoribosylanthranilate isomerase [bacterium]|nr:phosphoribosylanthranilate isomerase [bacterium]
MAATTRGGAASAVRVKICGIRRLADAMAAAEAGADAIGLNFWRPGRRYVPPEVARQIARAMPPFVCKVGVFINEDPETVREIARRVGLDALQLHGTESPEACAGFDLPVIKAIGVRGPESLAGLARYRVGGFLLDSHVPGEAGGTGRTFDWGLVARARDAGPIILSGGLTAENVEDAIRRARPYAVDVASGVETDGDKDPVKIRAFIGRVQAWNSEEVRR